MKTELIRQQQIFKEGIFCVGGRLYLFEEGRAIVLEGWPKLRAWQRLAGSTRFERTNPPVIIHEISSSQLSWLHLWSCRIARKFGMEVSTTKRKNAISFVTCDAVKYRDYRSCW